MTTPSVSEMYNPAIFRLYRKKRGWTQADSGQRVGHHQTWWSKLENGDLRPTTTDLEAIAAAFGITVKTLTRQLYGATDPAEVGR